MTIDRLRDCYNDLEPFIWYAVAAGTVPALRAHATLRLRLLLAGALIVFGTSEFYESQAWWQPWWLLAWKAGGLVAIVLLIAAIWRHRSAVAKQLGTDGAQGSDIN